MKWKSHLPLVLPLLTAKQIKSQVSVIIALKLYKLYLQTKGTIAVLDVDYLKSEISKFNTPT